LVNITLSIVNFISIGLIIFNLFFFVFNLADNHQSELFLFALSLKIILALLLIYYVLQTNKNLVNNRSAARSLDKFNEDLNDTYQNAFELKDLNDPSDPEILELIYKKADKKAGGQLLSTDHQKLKLALLPMGIIIILTLALSVFFQKEFSEARNFFKLRNLPPIQHKNTVELLPGDLDVVRNSRIEIRVQNPESDVQHKLFYRIDETWREEILSNYERVFHNLDFSFTYYIQTPYAVSDTFLIRVFELPAVKKLDVKYDYPQYTELEPEFDLNSSGMIRAIAGTAITLNMEANNPIEQGYIVFSDGSLKEIDRTGRASFKTDFILENNGSIIFKLTDILGNTSEKIMKSITVIPDKEPEIRIVYPGKDTLLTQNMLLPLQIYSVDDFGLKDLTLKYDINSSEVNTKVIQAKINEKVLNFEYIFDLTNTFLIPGDKVTYWVEISDNSPMEHTVSSRRYIAKFPSIEEIYQEIEREEKAKSDVLNKTLEESLELQKEFNEKQREMMKKEEFNWEDKKQLEEILKQQDDLNKNIENVAEDYQELMEKFQDNKALSDETLEKMEKIRELMEEIANEDLMDAMEKMQKNMDSMDPEDMKKAMEDFKFSMEEFSQKLEQTLDLLEDIKKEQAVQKSLEIAEEMQEMQSDLNDRTKDAAESNEKLAEDQKAIEEKLDSLQEQLKEASELMDPKEDQATKESLEELQENIDQDSLSEDLQEISEDLQKQNNKSAQKKQESALEKMKDITEQLNSMQQSMASGAMMEMGEILNKTIKRLLIFSREHEMSSQDYTDDPFFILHDQISIFESITLSLSKLYSVPMIMLALGPKFVYDANYTNSKYKEMFAYINDAKRSNVKTYLKDIQKGINLMIYDLIQASNNMQQGGGGGSMESMMQSLQQMGQQQMMMNMMSMQLMQQMGQNGRLSGDMMKESQRLAAEEQRLADNLKRMLQNDPEAQKQTSAINKIIDDLETISRNLQRGRITQDLIDQQERILSRLLDAQKSIHKREFSKKRKAETSEIEDWDLPEEIKLKFDKMRQKALLNEDYKDFPKEYRELIEEYLKLLNEKANEIE